jgi:hypothetical protein
MSPYLGNPILWNHRVERQQAAEAAEEAERLAGEAAIAEYERLTREASPIVIPGPRHSRRPVQADVVSATESTPAPEADSERQE